MWHRKLIVSKKSFCFSSRYFPNLSPMGNGMQRIICVVLGARWYPRFSIDSSTSFSCSFSPEEMNHRIMLSCPAQLRDTYIESKRLGNISSALQYTLLAQAAQVALAEQTIKNTFCLWHCLGRNSQESTSKLHRHGKTYEKLLTQTLTFPGSLTYGNLYP